jgi:hypothetical protein
MADFSTLPGDLIACIIGKVFAEGSAGEKVESLASLAQVNKVCREQVAVGCCWVKLLNSLLANTSSTWTEAHALWALQLLKDLGEQVPCTRVKFFFKLNTLDLVGTLFNWPVGNMYSTTRYYDTVDVLEVAILKYGGLEGYRAQVDKCSRLADTRAKNKALRQAERAEKVRTATAPYTEIPELIQARIWVYVTQNVGTLSGIVKVLGDMVKKKREVDMLLEMNYGMPFYCQQAVERFISGVTSWEEIYGCMHRQRQLNQEIARRGLLSPERVFFPLLKRFVACDHKLEVASVVDQVQSLMFYKVFTNFDQLYEISILPQNRYEQSFEETQEEAMSAWMAEKSEEEIESAVPACVKATDVYVECTRKRKRVYFA